MVSKHKTQARAYIEYLKERDIFREGNGKLLKDIQQFLDRTSEEFTNENSNKDSLAVNTHRDLVAGIVSKHYAVTQFMPKDVAKAHQQGFIHQHDTDYYISPLTNCIDQGGWITTRENGKITTERLIDLKERLNLGVGIYEVKPNIQVLSRNGWSVLKAISVRNLEKSEPMYTFKTRSGLKLKTTGNHRIPVIRDQEELVINAEEVQLGDSLLSSPVVTNTNEGGLLDLSKFINADVGLTFVGGMDKLQRYIQYKFNK